MTPLLDRLLALWTEPLTDRADPAADFRALYADPVPVNGTPLGAADLVARATALQTAYADRRTEIVHHLAVGDKLVVAFVMHVRHVGPLTTALGTVEPTGRRVAIRTTDILTVRDDRVVDVWVISDEVDVLRQLGRL